jgi:hypothetical protein
MTRLGRTFLLAGLALVGVAALLWVSFTAPSSSERAKARYDEERPFHFGPDDVAFGTVTSTHGAFRFERDEVFGWRIAEPIDWPAHAEPLEAMLVKVAGMAARRTVYEAPSPAELERAGLQTPRVRLKLTLASGEGHTLALGALHPLESLVYGRADGGPVFVAEPSVLWSSLRPVTEFRKTRVLPFDRSRVDALHFRRADGVSWTVRTSTPTHRVAIDGGPFHPADTGQVAVTMAAAFLRLEADRWLLDGAADLQTALRSHGADWKPAFSLSVRHQSGLVRTATVVAASRSGAPGPRPLAFVEGSLVELYPPPAEELMTLDPVLLRDRSLADFSPAAVERIVLIYGLELATLERGTEDWTLFRPSRAKPARSVGAEEIEEILKTLSRLKGADIVSEAPRPSQLREWLLQPPSRRFGLQGANQETLGVVTIGDLKDGEAFFVRGKEGPVHLVPRKALDAIPLQLSDFGQ